MRIFNHPTIQTKFLLGLTGIMLVMGLFFAFSLNIHLRTLMETEVSDQARLILAQVEAIQGYVRQVLRPAMYQLLPSDHFLLEAMSTSYVTRRIMTDLNPAQSHYTYRRVAVGARNPDFEANEMERALIGKFKAESSAPFLGEFRSQDDREYYLAARPVVIEAGCLRCHGRPEDAPKVLLEKYGPDRGFFRAAGEMVGLDLVMMPVQEAVIQIRQTTANFVVMFLLGTIFLFGLIHVFFQRLVVHNLRRLIEVLPRHFSEEADGPLMQKLRRGDEIDELMRAMEEFAGHLRAARRGLEDYAANLESMVETRTQELKREARERWTDVKLFIGLLDVFNQAPARRELIDRALALMGERLGADRAAYVCSMNPDRVYSWPASDFRPVMPADWTSLVAEGRPLFEPGRAYVPAPSSDVSRGLICFFWAEGELDDQTREVLQGLGRQLGLALENLEAMDNLWWQKDMLETIFEGISDPLALVDGSFHVILANRSARDLAASLGANVNDGAGFPFSWPGLEAGSAWPGTRGEAEPVSREIILPDQRSFAVNLYPLAGNESLGGRLVVYARENTAQRRMLAQMHRNEKIVAVGKLAAGLAHQINNPLGVIFCYAELLRAGALGPQEREDLEVIVNHARQAQRVLDDLLNFARPKQPGAIVCDPSAVLANLNKVFQVQAAARHVTLTLETEDGLPPLNADPMILEQIVTNLLINAFDAVVPEQGRVTVQAVAGSDSREVLLRVADNGSGIPPENLPLIFDPFFTTKDVGQGTGLGLSVVFGLVKELGGRIEVRNGQGAIFEVSLPVITAGMSVAGTGTC